MATLTDFLTDKQQKLLSSLRRVKLYILSKFHEVENFLSRGEERTSSYVINVGIFIENEEKMKEVLHYLRENGRITLKNIIKN